jgi:hypothetical protein
LCRQRIPPARMLYCNEHHSGLEAVPRETAAFMLNRRPFIAALAIAFFACATPPQPTRDTGAASASGSARRSVLPLINVPSKCHYLHHVQLPQRAATTTAVEETATALADDAGTTFRQRRMQ